MVSTNVTKLISLEMDIYQVDKPHPAFWLQT